MNKVTTAALAGLVAVTATANASWSRWNGFGDANSYIADVADIWTLPGVVASHKNTTYFEFGGSAYAPGNGSTNTTGQNQAAGAAWGGVHAEVGPGVLGVWVNRAATGNVKGTYGKMSFGFTGNAADNALVGTLLGITIPAPGSDASALYLSAGAKGRVDVLYGFSLNDGVDLGISISRANNNAKTENPGASTTSTFDASALGLGLGAELKEVAIFKLLEIGLIVDMDSLAVSQKTTTEDKFSASVNSYALRIGGDVAGEDGAFGRLEIGYTMGSGNVKNEPNTVPTVGNKEGKVSNNSWNLGYAMGKSGDKGLGLAGLMLKGKSGSTESDAANSKSESSDMSLQLTTAGEAKVKEWLTARAGLASNLYQSASTTGSGATPTKTNTSANGNATISTGLTADLGGITIDGVLNQDVLYNGAYFISGVPESIFTQISATWGW